MSRTESKPAPSPAPLRSHLIEEILDGVVAEQTAASTKSADQNSIRKCPSVALYAVKASIGPARYGFDFETAEILRMPKAGLVIDLPPRASYGFSILQGAAIIVWRRRNPNDKDGPETVEEFEKRVGKITLNKPDHNYPVWFDPAKHERDDEDGPHADRAFWGFLPGEHGGETPKNDFFVGSAFRVTLIARTDDVLMAVFSSEGPGEGTGSAPYKPVVS